MKIPEYEFKRGEPIEITFTFTENGVAKPIAGFEAKIQFRAEKPSGDVVGEWVDGDDELTRDDTAGVVILRIKPSATNDFKFTIAYFDLLLKQAADVDGIRSDLQIIKPRTRATIP